MDTAGQGGKKINFGQMAFAVQNGLIQVGNAPPLRNVEGEKVCQGLRGPAGGSVAPGAEGHQQLSVFIKGHIAVHHGGNAHGAHGGKLYAVGFLYVLRQIRIAGAKPRPDFIVMIGPNAVFQAVFPIKTAGRKRQMLLVDQYGFDAGGAQLNAKKGAAPEDVLFNLRRIHMRCLLYMINKTKKYGGVIE